jgi:DNA-binding PadR family transcriptional regulator
MQQVERERHLDTILPLDTALIYYYLKKLVRRGWLTAVRADHPTRPPRQLCQLTPAGRQALTAWLATPCEADDPPWTTFLLKLFLAQRLGPAQTTDMIRQQHAACRRCQCDLLHGLAAEDVEATGHAESSFGFSRLVLQMRLRQLQAFMAWLEEADMGPLSPLERRTL